MEPDSAGLSAIVSKILSTNDPWWWIGGLSVLVGIPTFLAKLPETIKAISAYHDTHRKTSHKIQLDRDKLQNAIDDRKTKAGKPKGRKK